MKKLDPNSLNKTTSKDKSIMKPTLKKKLWFWQWSLFLFFVSLATYVIRYIGCWNVIKLFPSFYPGPLFFNKKGTFVYQSQDENVKRFFSFFKEANINFVLKYRKSNEILLQFIFEPFWLPDIQTSLLVGWITDKSFLFFYF